MLGVVSSLFGFLVAVALMWFGVFQAIRRRRPAPRHRAAREEPPQTAEQLVESWRKSS